MIREQILNAAILIVIFLFLLSYFKPSLILLDTTTSGGDTGSHNYLLWYLKYGLLPKGRLSGWSPGWYAGFPMFQFYFVLPFLLMVLLGYLVPLWVSFKIVTVLGTFLLPVAAFVTMKLMKFKFPTPILAALFTLPFLFMEANSMWGGNIPSTLAGEFSYSISFAFAIIFLGLVYHLVKATELRQSTRKLWVVASAVFAVVVLCHIYTAVFAAVAPVFFLLGRTRASFVKNFKRNFVLLFKIYFLAFLLSAFWTVPLFMKFEYATSYHYVWSSVKLEEVFPKILLPTALLAAVGIYVGLKESDDRIAFLFFAFVLSFILYKVSPLVGMTDIRFVPVLQFTPALIAAYFAAYFISDIKLSGKSNLGSKLSPKLNLNLKFITVFIILVLTLWWVDRNVTYIDFWIKWNYEGFQNKNHWHQLNNITTYLRNLPEGRVVHEYSNLHDKFGTPRTFENTPLFTGKPTLEGLNIESALSAPYVFTIQAEISATSTCPIPELRCGSFNIRAAEKHLELFNIRYIIATTDKLKNTIKNETSWSLLDSFGEIEIYEVGHTSYVSIPKYRPLMFKKRDTNWKDLSFAWFKNVNYIDVPIAFVEDPGSVDPSTFGPVISSLEEITKIPIDTNCSIFSEEVKDDEIKIKTDCIGRPLLIKISYFPNWKVEGADKIYIVSPSFMMVFPEQADVRLYYGYTFSDYLGIFLSVIGIVAICLLLVFRKMKL